LLDIGRCVCLSIPACDDNGSIKRADAVAATLRNRTGNRNAPVDAHLGERMLWGDPGNFRDSGFSECLGTMPADKIVHSL
jgi:hypothetical protein